MSLFGWAMLNVKSKMNPITLKNCDLNSAVVAQLNFHSSSLNGITVVKDNLLNDSAESL